MGHFNKVLKQISLNRYDPAIPEEFDLFFRQILISTDPAPGAPVIWENLVLSPPA